MKKLMINVVLGITLVSQGLTSALAVGDATDSMATPQPLHILTNISAAERAAYAPMTADQLDTVKGTAGICEPCLNAQSLLLIENLRDRSQFSQDVNSGKTNTDQYVIGSTPADLLQGKMISLTLMVQTFTPLRKQLAIDQTQGSLEDQRLIQQIQSVTQQTVNQFINQKLPPLQNLQQGGGLSQQIITSTQQQVNQILNKVNLPGGGIPF